MAKKGKIKRIHYRDGCYWKTPHGTWQAHIWHAYKRHTQRFKSEAAARAYIDQTLMAIHNESRPLTDLQYRDARLALDNLMPNLSLCDAVQFYNRHHNSTSITLKEAIEAFLADKQSAGLRKRTMTGHKSLSSRLLPSFGTYALNQIDTQSLIAWLDANKYTGETRGNYRRAWINLFNWCIASGYMAHNPAAGITAPRIERHAPEFLGVKQAKHILSVALEVDPPLATFFAVGLFSGVRVEELYRLTPEAFKDNEHIRIGESIAKTRQMRFVTISPNLRKWLQKTPWPARFTNLRKRREFIVDKAEIEWPQNAMRHSFCTYHIALHKNANETALEMGHSKSDILFLHYRGLTTQKEASEYFKITPTVSK